LQTKYRKLRNDLDGIQEVVASLLKRAQS